MAERRDLILRTALEVFVTEDLQAASMAKIAKTAGIPVGSIYTYFKGKDALVREVYLQGRRDLQARLLEAIAGEGDDEYAARFQAVWRALIAHHMENAAAFLFAERLRASPYFDESLRAANAALWTDLDQLYGEARDAGALKLLPRPVLLAMVSGTLGAVVKNHIQGIHVLDGDAIRLVTESLWDAVAARG